MGVFSQPTRGLYCLRCSGRKVVRVVQIVNVGQA